MALAVEVLGQAAQEHAGCHKQRHRAERHEEQHRHQHELGGDREAVADREVHPRHQRVGGEERGRERRRRTPCSAGSSDGEGDGHGEEARRPSRPRPAARGRGAARGGPCPSDSCSSSTAGVRPERRSSKIRIGSRFIGRWRERRDGRSFDGRTLPARLDGCPLRAGVLRPDSRPMRTRLRSTFVAAAVAAAALAIGAPAASAGLLVESADDCPTPVTSKAFAPWGDNADYQLAPGGAFEAGDPSWQLNSGASVVSGQRAVEGERRVGLALAPAQSRRVGHVTGDVRGPRASRPCGCSPATTAHCSRPSASRSSSRRRWG